MPDRSAIFDRVRQSNMYAKRKSPERHAKLPVAVSEERGLKLVIALALCALVPVIGLLGVNGLIGAEPQSTLVRVGVSLAAALVLGALGWFGLPCGLRLVAWRASPLSSDAAVVVLKRQTHGKAPHSYLTLEFSDGQRREYRVVEDNEELYGRLDKGDAGVAFTRLDLVLGFDQVMQ
jgi:hypothetical protein